jgi:hypothetical protein
MRIDNLDQWADVAQHLSAHGYMLWQTQYDIDCPDGFIARFMTPDDSEPRLEHNTFDAKVRAAMIRYKP